MLLTAKGRRRVEQGSPHVRTVTDAIGRHLSGDAARVYEAVRDLRHAVQAAFEELEASA